MKDSGLQTAIGRADSGISIESVVSIERLLEKRSFSTASNHPAKAGWLRYILE